LAGEGNATILSAFAKNEPATVPLALAYANSPIEVVTMAFSAIALTVSYVLQAASLRGFFRDLIASRAKGKTGYATALLTFLPPLGVVLVYPKIFLTALDLIGGVSIMLLFGILPALVALRSRAGGSSWNRAGALVLLLVFSSLMVLELMQEFGYLKIRPEVEYWFFQVKGSP
jgi:tyrosine-specific transport protein